MDCTYETYKHRMPVLNIVGLTPNNTTFFVIFCTVKQEGIGDYKWALEQELKSLYIGADFPAIIATHQELRLMKAISAVFDRNVWEGLLMTQAWCVGAPHSPSLQLKSVKITYHLLAYVE